MLASLYAAYALIRCWLDPSLGPILSPEDQPQTSPYYWLEAILVIGSILLLFTFMIMGLNGNLYGLFPFSSFIIPAAWVGLMYGASIWVRDNKPKGFYFSDLWYEFFMGLVPPSTLVAFALGSILFGWATPTEGAACGAFGALVLALAYRKLTWQGLFDALVKTLELTVLILFLVGVKLLWCCVLASWHANDANRLPVGMGIITNDDFDHHHGTYLPTRLAT